MTKAYHDEMELELKRLWEKLRAQLPDTLDRRDMDWLVREYCNENPLRPPTGPIQIKMKEA